MQNKRFSSVLLACGLAVSIAPGQSFYGSIVGTVTDSSGGLVPAARVTIINLGTTEKRAMQTSATGFYQFVNLVPSRYRVEVEKDGFKRFTRQPIVVEVQNAVRIDISLEVGATSQAVEVTGETPLLQPQTSSLGQVVEGRKATELPLNGRNIFALVSLVPGVVPQGQAGASPVGVNQYSWANFQIGGGQANQNDTYLDGAPVTINNIHLTSLVPTQDSIQEFKVQTNNSPSDFGRFSGGVINLTTKSGSNEFHGSVYEFLRNKALNANTFFNNRSGIGTPPFTQNQFGVSGGGPLVIPHLYDGHDKLFFFASYEGTRVRQGLSFLTTVPTAAQRQGDFSDLRDARGNVIPLYDPTTTRSDPSNPGRYIRDPVSCGGRINVICPQRIDSAALALTKIFATPNLAGNINNYAANASTGGNNDQFIIRMDRNVSSKQRIFTRYTYWTNLALEIDPYKTHALPGGGNAPQHFATNNWVLADTYTFSPRTVGDFRLSYNRYGYDSTPGSFGVNPSSIGLPASLGPQSQFLALPALNVAGMNSLSPGPVIFTHNDDITFFPSLTQIWGRHTVKFGGELRINRQNTVSNGTPLGSFSFDANFTASDPFRPAGGFGFASFMLGHPSSGSFGYSTAIAGQEIYRGVYVNDTFQVTSRLALNLGLRYEQPGPWTERYDRISVFLSNAASPLAQPTGLPLAGRIAAVNSPDRSGRSAIEMNRKAFSPRIGFAYRLAQKTVARGGYGLSWLPNDVSGRQQPDADPINAIGTTMVTTTDGGLTPADRLSNPFPTGILRPYGRDPRFQQLLLGQGLVTAIANNPLGYAQQWNFGLQQELPLGIFTEATYAGAKGTHLPFFAEEQNTLPERFMSMGSALVAQVRNPFLGLITSGPLAAPTISQGQLLLRYPQYTRAGLAGQGSAASNYHALQTKVERRFRGGSSLLVAYTVSKLISTAETLTGFLEASGTSGIQNWNNIRADRGLATFDTPQRLVASYVLDLPSGGVRGPAAKVLAGWSVQGITTFQSGNPLFLRTSQNLTNSFGGGSRPNNNGRGAALSGPAQPRIGGWFDISVFSQPPAFTYGNTGRTLPDVRTHGINNFDFAAVKSTKFGPENKLALQFRGEFFNIFNRARFGYPGMFSGTPQFGVVSSQVNNPRLVQFALRMNY
jgi:hypothetical protein